MSVNFNSKAARASLVDYFNRLDLIDDQSSSGLLPSYSSSSSYGRISNTSGGVFDCLSSVFSCLFPQTQRFSGSVALLDRQGQKEAYEDERNTRAALFNGASVLVLTGVFTYLWDKSSELEEALKEAEQKRQEVKDLTTNTPDHNYGSLLELFNSSITVKERQCAFFRKITIVTGGLLASAAAGFIGGMVGVSWLVTASVIGGVVFLAIGIVISVPDLRKGLSLTHKEQQDLSATMAALNEYKKEQQAI